MNVPPNTLEMAYAVHTTTCTYLLDEDGVCRWIVSPQGVVPSHVRQAIEAQFVACLDLDVAGGLVGELKLGGMALFVKHEDDRLILLRTGVIQHVDDRRSADTKRQPAKKPPPEVKHRPVVRQYGQAGGMPYMAKPPPRIGLVRRVGEETTITVTLAGDSITRRRHVGSPSDPSGENS